LAAIYHQAGHLPLKGGEVHPVFSDSSDHAPRILTEPWRLFTTRLVTCPWRGWEGRWGWGSSCLLWFVQSRTALPNRALGAIYHQVSTFVLVHLSPTPNQAKTR